MASLNSWEFHYTGMYATLKLLGAEVGRIALRAETGT